MGLTEAKEKIVLDLETKKSFAEVDKGRPELLGVSIVGIYSYREDEYKTFPENQIKQLIPYLEQAELIIGFNIKRFDFPVLQPYLDFDLKALKCLDIFEEVQNNLGFRLGLNALAQATLNIGKSGSGLDALKYFRQGKMQELAQYCQQDVFVTRQLYEYGRKHGHLIYRRGLKLETIPVGWGEGKTIDEILHQAMDKRRSVEIEYSSANNNASGRQLRRIDIYDFDLGRVVAFCHLRQDMRTFNIRRVLSARLTENQYEIPADFNLRKFLAKRS